MTDEDVIKVLWPNKISLLKRYLGKGYNLDEFIKYLDNRFEDSSCIEESLYRIKYNILNKPVCPTCGKPLPFLNMKGGKFKKICGYKCSNSNPQKIQKTIDSLKDKYGVSNVFQLKEIKEKIIKNNLEKYGVKWNTERNDVKEKINKKWKSHTKEYKQQIREKTIKTCIKKYKCENPFQNKEIQNKYKQTCLAKYGETNHMKSEKYKKIFSNLISSYEIQSKINESKRKNHTFNSSKVENASFILLKEYYSDTVTQYNEIRYPFACDFYIPSLDLFIECNYHWTHGRKPYEGTEDDKQIVEKWKAKGTKFYINAIQTWTIRDVNKRNIAKQNKLNYIEFWNINELINWLKNNHSES